MRWRALLIVSACVNAVLIAAVWYVARKSPGPEGVGSELGTNGPAKVRTQVVVRRQFFTWSEVESPDYHTYIANLRDIGCPEQTIRDIILADVNALFARRAALEIKTPGQQWWRSTPDARLGLEAQAKLRELDKERRKLLAELLGPDWSPAETFAATTAKVPLDGPVLGLLPNDTKEAINSVVAESQSRMEALQAKAAAEGRYPTSTELAALREQTRQELQKILPPAQLEEFLLRYSQNAADLRSELGSLQFFNASPEEFRAMFRARDQYDQKIAALADSTDPNDISQRQSLEAQRERALRLALGEERYALYRQLQNPDYRTAYAQATKAGDPDAARTIYEVNLASQEELAKAQADSNLSAEQLAIAMKRVELEQAKATAEAVGQDIPPDPNAPPPPPPPPENRSHTIVPGDTLGALSTAYGLPVNAIMDANPDLQVNALKPGQRIIIPPALQQAQ